MNQITLLFLALSIAPTTAAAQQPTAPPPAAPTTSHDTVRGAIRAIDVGARTLDVTTGVGYALRVLRLQVPPTAPITAREDGQREPIQLSELKLGDVVRAAFGGQPSRFIAYTIERVGRMRTGVDSTP